MLSNLLAVPSKWQLPSNNCRLAIDISCTSCSWNFSSYFQIFPFCGRCRQQVLKPIRFPLCNNTTFRLCMEESVNIHHSYGLNLMFIVAIRPLTILQTLSSPCVVETCSKLSWRERNAVIFTVSSGRFNCWSLEDNSSAFLFNSFRSLIGSKCSFCLILRGSAEVRFRKTSGYPEVDGCCDSSGLFSFPRPCQGKKLSGVLE